MARATGGDVVIRLMTDVAELQQAMRGQSEKMESLSRQMKDVEEGLDEVTVKVGAATVMTDELSKGMRANVETFGRIGRMLNQLATNTSERFDSLEDRVEALERRGSGKK